MKILSYLIYVTIITGIYSCESSNKPNSNPLNYKFEQPYFEIEPYVPYRNLINRINIGTIHNYDLNKDSNYIRATFYNDIEFRKVGDLYYNDKNIETYDAEELFGIVQLVDDFIEFGEAYYSNDIKIELGDSININNSKNSEFVEFKVGLKVLDEKLVVNNVSDLQEIDKSKEFYILTNLENYTNTRIRIYNETINYVFYSSTKDSISFGSNSLRRLEPDIYTIEVIKGYYIIDTLDNNETLITNHYSSFIFNTNITE